MCFRVSTLLITNFIKKEAIFMFDLLNKIVNENKKYIKNGHVATYIPALAEVDENQLGVAIVDLRDCYCKEYFAGDYNKSFAIESTSKVIALIMAMMDNSPQYVFRRIGVEPSGFAFNSILNMKISIFTIKKDMEVSRASYKVLFELPPCLIELVTCVHLLI